MPAIRRKPSEDSASHKRHRKSIKLSYLSDSSESEEEYVDLEANLDVASRSESSNDGSSGVSTGSVARRGAANNATEATAPEPIAICGILLRPTVAFDTFWRFAAERKAIYDRRRAGEPAP